MNMNPQAQQVCASALSALDGLHARFKQAKRDDAADGVLSLQGSFGRIDYAVQYRERVTTEQAGLLAEQLQHKTAQPRMRPLLLAPYVHPGLGELLRAQHIDFLDAVGNASLQHDGLYVWVSGRRDTAATPRAPRAFQATGLRLLTLLLEAPDAVSWPQRTLAARAGISLGAVGPVLDDLRAGGYLRTSRKKQRVLVNRQALFERWSLGYVETLRPKLALRTCRVTGSSDLEELTARIEAGERGATLAGGELAAARWTKHLRPARGVLYVATGTVEQAMVRLRLLPDPQGNVEMLRAVLPPDVEAPQSLASPFLVHAELLRGEPDSRLRETADMIFDRLLRARLQEPAT